MPNKKSSCAKVLLGAGLLSLSLAASAFEDGNPAFYADAGRAPHRDTHTRSMTIGAVLPWGAQHLLWGTRVTSYAELSLSQWQAPTADRQSHRNYLQLGAIAGWRFRFDEGASPWFFDAGLGGTQMNDRYESPDRRFSTRFQFTEQFGIGRSFGERGGHELSLRIQHFSNGGIKKPNPGENFYMVRYLYRF